MGGCQNDSHRLRPLNTRCRIAVRTQKGTIILTTTHIQIHYYITSFNSNPRELATASIAAPREHFGSGSLGPAALPTDAEAGVLLRPGSPSWLFPEIFEQGFRAPGSGFEVDVRQV